MCMLADIGCPLVFGVCKSQTDNDEQLIPWCLVGYLKFKPRSQYEAFDVEGQLPNESYWLLVLETELAA